MKSPGGSSLHKAYKTVPRFLTGVLLAAGLLCGCKINPYQPLILAVHGEHVPEGFPEAVTQEKPDLSGIYRWSCSRFVEPGDRQYNLNFYWLITRGGSIKESAKRFEIVQLREGVFRMTPLLDFGKRYESLDIEYVYEAPWFRLKKPTVITPPTYVRLGLDNDGNLIGYEQANHHFSCRKSE